MTLPVVCRDRRPRRYSAHSLGPAAKSWEISSLWSDGTSLCETASAPKDGDCWMGLFPQKQRVIKPNDARMAGLVLKHSIELPTWTPNVHGLRHVSPHLPMLSAPETPLSLPLAAILVLASPASGAVVAGARQVSPTTWLATTWLVRLFLFAQHTSEHLKMEAFFLIYLDSSGRSLLFTLRALRRTDTKPINTTWRDLRLEAMLGTLLQVQYCQYEVVVNDIYFRSIPSPTARRTLIISTSGSRMITCTVHCQPRATSDRFQQVLSTIFIRLRWMTTLQQYFKVGQITWLSWHQPRLDNHAKYTKRPNDADRPSAFFPELTLVPEATELTMPPSL